MPLLATRCLPFDELTLREWHDITRLRVDVFVVEQECPYPEIDGRDLTAQHLLGYVGGRFHSYARIFEPEAADAAFHIGRVIVRSSYRGKGLGDDLMRACLDWIRSRQFNARVHVQAQAHLQEWYESLGFTVLSDAPYDWDGIPHVDMEILLSKMD